MKIKFCLLFIIVLFLTSCEFGTHFKIENKSNTNIQLVVFSNGPNKINVKNLKKNAQYTGFLDFSENGPNYDGNYGVIVHYFDTVRTKRFGYYSNGIPFNMKYEIIIKNDTIIVNEHFEQ